ncbi:MAG TPA: hypothetical protein VHD62_03150 [Opitutaceae bacterium]|nr:hypothetical protein [Opitutaceae bacterium]
MKPIQADAIAEGLSDDLQDLLVREAFVRRQRERVRAELVAKRAEVAGFTQTRPAFLAFRKGAKENFESAEQRLRGELAQLEQLAGNCDLILEKSDRTIQAGLDELVEAEVPEFRAARAAEKLLPEWEQSIGLYRAALKQFVATLGVARNQMASGYDRKAGKFAPGAMEAFDAAIASAKRLEVEMAEPNQLARRHRELLGLDASTTAVASDQISPLPYLPNHGPAKLVTALKAASLEVAAARIVGLIDECERMHAEGVPALLEEMARVRDGHAASRRRHLLGPLEQIRAMADGAVDPVKMNEVYAAMEARFVTLTG